jgi:putative ABC transport system substrate-binding protein
MISDPLGSGLVSNMAKPGASATGFTNFEFTVGGKWVQLIKELVPDTQRLAVVFNPGTAPFAEKYLQPARAASSSIGIDLITSPVYNRDQLERELVEQGQSLGRSIMLIPDNFTLANRQQIILLAARYRLPIIYPYRPFVLDGGLIAYSPDIPELYRRSAIYADRILRGEKPGDLPVEQPTKFELVINVRAARTIGLTIPPSLFARADEVIE